MPNAIYPNEKDPKKLDGFIKRHKWARQFVKDKVVIDAACGSGYGTSFYSDLAKQPYRTKPWLPLIPTVIGIDHSAENVDFADKNYGSPKVVFSCADMRKPIQIDRQADVVIMFEVLEHFQPDSAELVLRNAYNLLKPNGILIGTTPRMKDHTRYYSDKADGEHCVIYDRPDLIKKLSAFDSIDFHNIGIDWAHSWTCRKPLSKSVEIVILSLDRVNKTQYCISSLYRGSNKELFHITIIENGSNRHIQNGILNIKGAYPDISVIFNRENRGVGMARAQGASYGKSPYLMFLDNDMTVSYGFVEALLETIKQADDIGAVGAKVVMNDKVQLCGRYIIDDKLDYSRDKIALDDPRGLAYANVDIIHGGATLYKRSAYESANFDHHYFIGYEDLDMMMQLRQNNYRLVYCPKAMAYHSPDFSGEYAKVRRDGRHIQNSKQYFERKWGIKT